MSFKKGTRVKKTNGKRTAIVEDSYYIRWEHNNHREYVGNYSWGKYVEVKDEEMNIETFFEDKDGKICTKLLEKSSKAWVVEYKGSNSVEIVDPKDLTEILPFTIEVNISGKVNHYRVDDEEKYQVDDVFLMGKSLEIARVTKTNTKKKTVSGDFKPFAKLQVLLDF